MASSYSSDLKLELMVTGENAGTWGDKTNTNLNLVQQAIAGFEQVTLSSGGTLALVMSDGALSNARNLVIKFATATIAASTICTIPDSIEKFYIFDCTGLTNPSNLTIKTASGTGFTPDAAKIYAAYSDGTNLNEVSLDTLGGTVAAAQIADSAVTTAKIADDAVTSAKIADDAVVTAAIADDAVTQANIADDAVGADQLANTSVTAGSYTSSSITVDAQGRITAASSGAGAANFKTMLFRTGPASGNLAADPSTNKTQAYLFAGGGGGSGGGNPNEGGRGGGTGGFGYYTGPVSGGATVAFSIGSGGNGGPGQPQGGNPGNSGNATTFHNFTTNGGQGATGNSPGSSGNAPGADPAPISSGILFTNARSQGGNAAPPNSSTGGNGGGGGLVVFFNEG